MSQRSSGEGRHRAGHFLWINKTPTSTNLLRSTAAEMQHIQRFVQHNFKSHSRNSQKHHDRATGVFTVRLGYQRHGHSYQSPTSEYDPFNSRLTRWRVISPRLQQSKAAIDDASTVIRSVSRKKPLRSRRKTGKSLLPVVKNRQIIPGRSHYTKSSHAEFEICLSQRAMKLGIGLKDFHGFFEHIMVFLDISSMSHAESYASHLFRWSMMHDDIFLGIALNHQCWRMRENLTTVAQEHEIDHLRNKFLQKLDDRLLCGVVDEVLAQVILLAAEIDVNLEYDEFLTAHLGALHSIMQDWIVADTSTDSAREFLFTSVVVMHFQASLAGPQHDLSCSSPSDVSVDVASEWMVLSLPKGFQGLVSKGYLSLAMVQILSLYFSPASPPDGSFITRMKNQTIMALLEFNWIDLSILIAVFLLTDDRPHHKDHTAFVLAQKLHGVLMSIVNNPQIWQNTLLNDLVLWLVAVFVTSTTVDQRAIQNLDGLLRRILDQRPDIRHPDELETTLRRFLSPECLLKQWRDVWYAMFETQ